MIQRGTASTLERHGRNVRVRSEGGGKARVQFTRAIGDETGVREFISI